MLIRKVSIVTLVSTFFALTLVVINIAFVIEYKRQISDLQFFAFQRFLMAMKVAFHNDADQEATLSKLGVRISTKDKQVLLTEGVKLLEDPFSDMIMYEQKLYFVHRDPPHPPPPPPPPSLGFNEGFPPPLPMKRMQEPPILENIVEFSPYRLWILGGVINTLLLLFFGIVLRKLLRLRNLKSAIRTFGDTKKFQPIGVESEDELGEIASEFNLAMEKIHLLKEARTLFLRNILHELKTPIMKGKILSNSLENAKQQTQLERIFERLETLLGEMVKVEKLSSNEWVLEVKEYRLVDVLDHAMDLLLSDTKRIHILPQEMAPLVNVDFELCATAIKNLLDNALKHSSEAVEVDIGLDSISICSLGEKIPSERLDFSRAFNRAVEGSSSGLGLGLYIANAIIEKHGFKLSYLHVEGQNHFTIHFKEKKVEKSSPR